MAHHVTQRGNHREPVFFSPGDQAAYLTLLRDHAIVNDLQVIAYCLMPNHVHHIVVPSTPVALHRVFKSVHGQYAQRVNRMRDQKGHLWQGRYFSSPLDSDYFLNAVRYVELNPVRARMVERAEDYPWSSAATHCGLREDVVVDPRALPRSLAAIGDWSRWLSQGIADASIAELRRNGRQNLPCGSEEFVSNLEKITGRELNYRTHGGVRKQRTSTSSK